MPFPSPPWQMNAQMWLSVFRVREGAQRRAPGDRPPGLYGAAFVSYEEGSPLTYLELLVARLEDLRARRVRITDIWVDSADSMLAGRSLWAIPKELAKLEVEDRHLGPTSHTEFAGHLDGQAFASGQFAALPGASLVRLPVAGSTSQLRGEGPDAQEVVTSLSGSAKSLPALATWEFDAHGPLAFLHGQRPIASFRLTDLRLTFG